MTGRLIVFSIAACAGLAQQQATITGTVTNLDGGPVKNAPIRARNTVTGAVTPATSSAAGTYSLQLPPGSYDLSIPMACCNYGRWSQDSVAVQAGRTLRLDVRLPWGPNLGTLKDDPADLLDELREQAPIPTGPLPRTHDGKPDLSGMWLNVFDPDMPQPQLQPWAAELHRKRGELDKSKDYPGGYCLPANASPVTRAFPYKFVQAPTVIVVLNENDTPGHRQIFMDGRPHPANLEPTWLGHSIGRWDGETLVVDTIGYNDKAWLSLSGVPHTDRLHVIERYRRVDLGHMQIEVEMEDPGAFTGVWKRNFRATLAPPGEDVMEYVCENNRDIIHYR